MICLCFKYIYFLIVCSSLVMDSLDVGEISSDANLNQRRKGAFIQKGILHLTEKGKVRKKLW